MENPSPGDEIVYFCRQTRARSREHREVMAVAHERGWRSTEIGILRQELDSFVRVVYLLRVPNQARRSELLVKGTSPDQNWGISDGQMAEPTRRLLYGWESLAYRYSSRFIHLSSQHDYVARDPFMALPMKDRSEIVEYLNREYTDNLSADCSFASIAEYIPKIFSKISNNLEIYLQRLENGENYFGDADSGAGEDQN